MRMTIPVALVGIGKIARDQHIPAIAADPDFQLVAAVSRHGSVEGVPQFHDMDDFLRRGPEAAVSLCVPPSARTEMALKALAAGRDVMLEKPTAATLGEVEAMVDAARASGATLFATWHSREAPGVIAARDWLSGRRVVSASIIWKEDVRRWHPGQEWIWEPAGFGVFDPGINALSILTAILPGAFRVEAATLVFPENRQTPVAATVGLRGAGGFPVSVELDWLQEGPQTWDIAVETETGGLVLSDGGATLRIDGGASLREPEREYPRLYRRFAELVKARESDVDASPLRIVADAFLMGRREIAPPFLD